MPQQVLTKGYDYFYKYVQMQDQKTIFCKRFQGLTQSHF